MTTSPPQCSPIWLVLFAICFANIHLAAGNQLEGSRDTSFVDVAWLVEGANIDKVVQKLEQCAAARFRWEEGNAVRFKTSKAKTVLFSRQRKHWQERGHALAGDLAGLRDRRWEPMMELGGWRWMKAAPTFLPVFEPSEKKRTSGSIGEGEDPVWVEVCFGWQRGDAERARKSHEATYWNVCSDHGFRSEAILSMWSGGSPRCGFLGHRIGNCAAARK